jgi:tight adherence protein B
MEFLSCIALFGAVVLAVESIGGVWDVLSRKHIADLSPMLDALSIDRSKVAGFLRLWGASLLGSFILVAFILVMPPLSIAAVGLVYVAPRIILQMMIERRRRLLRDQMVGASIAMANTCRAGLSLAQGLEMVGDEAPDPLASELRKIVRDYKHGRPLAEAISDTKQRLNVDSFTLFASAVLISLERGGKITDSLERISSSLAENQRVERNLESQTAGGKQLVWILAVFPFLFLLGFYFLHPTGTTEMFQSLIGQLMLLVVIGLVYASVRWSVRILSIEL